MLLISPTGETASIATLAALAVQYLPRMYAHLTRGQLAARKATLEELRAGQVNLDNAYQRLEGENKRLHGEIDELRAELINERRRHDKTRRRCEQMAEILRMMGKRLPPEVEE